MRADERYRPQRRLIDDVRETPSYYRAADVGVSPFTPIGQVAHNMPEAGSVPVKVHRKPSRPRMLPPIIPAGFLTKYNNPAEDEFAPPRRPEEKSDIKAAPTGVAALASSLWSAVAGSRAADAVLTRKAMSKSHKVSKYAGSALVIAVLIALLLDISPVPSARIHSPAAGAGSPDHGVNGTYTSNFVTSPKGSGSGATESTGNKTSGNPASQPSLDSNVIGGMGGGSFGGVTQPVAGTVSGVTAPITGGSGGGSVLPTNSPSIPGVTQPQPVTLPGTSVDLLGKPVISTSPIGVTLN